MQNETSLFDRTRCEVVIHQRTLIGYIYNGHIVNYVHCDSLFALQHIFYIFVSIKDLFD